MAAILNKKQIILLASALIIVGLFFLYGGVTKPDTANSDEAIRAYASSTNYILIEEEAIFAGEEVQAASVRADQPVMEKYKNLFDE